MDIKSRLMRLDKELGEKPEQPPEVEIPEDWVETFQRELDARILREGNSFIILKENYYPVYRNDAFRLLQEDGFRSRHILKLAAMEEVEEINWWQTLFIDLETTGLAGGTGTYAFLVGLGHIEVDHIVVRQYLLPDFQHEWLLLKQVENALLQHQFIVSFNGKSFDIPLLRNRFVLNRMETVLDELHHLDVLHAARRVWKQRLGSCDLQNLEKHILGQSRIADLPGELIPQVYFEYIRKREALLLRDVLEHNFHDIVNMILLALELDVVSREPQRRLRSPHDVISLARFYYQRKYFDEALPLLQLLVETQSHNRIGEEAMFLLSMIYKKQGEVQEASRMLQRLWETRQDHPGAIEELAKYYEHREKDYQAALEVVNQALAYMDLLEQLERKANLVRFRESLQHRQQRLMRKLQRQELRNRKGKD